MSSQDLTQTVLNFQENVIPSIQQGISQGVSSIQENVAQGVNNFQENVAPSIKQGISQGVSNFKENVAPSIGQTISQELKNFEKNISPKIEKGQKVLGSFISQGVSDLRQDMINYTSTSIDNKTNFTLFLITIISIIFAYVVKNTGGMDEKFILYFIYFFIIFYVLWNISKNMFSFC